MEKYLFAQLFFVHWSEKLIDFQAFPLNDLIQIFVLENQFFALLFFFADNSVRGGDISQILRYYNDFTQVLWPQVQ